MDLFSGGKVSFEIMERRDTGAFLIRIEGATDGVLHVPVEWDQHVARSFRASAFDFQVAWQADMIHIHVCLEQGSVLLLHPSPQRGPTKVVELFGGISGWSHAMHECNMSPVAIVEKDRKTAEVCAQTWQCEVIDPKTFLQRALLGDVVSPVVVEGSAVDYQVWMAFGILNVSTALASPPCPPWSSAGAEKGLKADDGKVLSDLLIRAGQFKLVALLIENVPGIVSHEDFQVLLAGAALHGMKLILAGVHNISRCLPVYRDRWLATFVHSSITLAESDVQAAVGLTLASEGFSLPGPNLSASDCIRPVDASDRSHLMPSKEALTMLGRSDLVPKWMAGKINWHDDEPVLKARVIAKDKKLSGVMARYGSQHLLPLEHLKAKGLQTVLFDDAGTMRYFCPWEILASLGFPSKVVISADLAFAFQLTGNAISPVHAWIQIARTYKAMGFLSPFPQDLDVSKALRMILDKSIKLSAFACVIRDPFAVLEVAIQATEETDPLAKRARTARDSGWEVTPTVPFAAVTESSKTESDFTRHLQVEPKFHVGKMTSASMQPFCQGGILFLKHVQNNWIMVVHGAVDEKLEVLILRALPHANDMHFRSFLWRGKEITWQDMITCAPPTTVIFVPKSFVVTCYAEDGNCIYMNADVTWTVKTVIAFLAGRMGCQADAISLAYNGIDMKDCDFVAEFPTWRFQIRLNACLPGYITCAPMEVKVREAGMIPAHNGCIRFVAKHPAMKIIRTACVSSKAAIASVVRVLFPDLCSTVSWTAHIEGVPVDVNMVIGTDTKFEIEWDCFKPLAPTSVHAARFNVPIDAAQMQVKFHDKPERWIRSPLRSKAQVLRTDEDSMLMQLAASFVSHAQLDLSITCHLGSVLTDPTIPLADVPVNEVVSFKIAPLVGGAKKSGEAIKNRVSKALEEHGVQKETCNERANAFFQKADIETLGKAESADDEEFWRTVKDEANRVHFRLVYRNEMKQMRKDNRRKPPGKDSKKSQKGTKHDGFVASASNIVIDMKHFKADDEDVDRLEASRFGPDQKGVAIMELAEADRYVDGTSISVDPLAILIVGNRFGPNDEPFTMPAHTVEGMPIIIHAALRQYGDRMITFKAAVPVSNVDTAASTVIELHIFRKEVGSWKECSVPLHYLGVHISAVRGSSLIATWSMKTWSEGRKPVPFMDAAYWHGFFRVPDEILDQVLARSGHAGIYVAPKDDNRRHDERFSVIAMPELNLLEVQKKAALYDKALGIVKLRDQFAIRCRREHSSNLRASLLPESAFVASEGVGADDSIWVLKNMPPEVGKEGLQSALLQSGWDAVPVRAQGQNRWLVAAKLEPDSKHFCINGSYVLVEPIKRQRDNHAVTITAKQVKVDTTFNATQGSMQMATSTRIQEVKAEISDHMEMKMQAANQRIEQLSGALERLQAEQSRQEKDTKAEFASIKNEQAFARQKIGEVEASVVQSGQTVINTMQQMMSNLEANMKQWMVKSEVGDSKRHRAEETPRNDTFSTKS